MFKKLLSLSAAAFIALSMSVTVFAQEPNVPNQVETTAVQEIVTTVPDNNLIEATDEVDGLSGIHFGNPIVSSQYYYNSGTTCPEEVKYDKYDLLNKVKKGDVLFEANGGFGITGHCAIVEGIFLNDKGERYIRVIEAIEVGVCRGVLDDTRVDERKVTVLRVKNANIMTIDNAVKFAVGQLGKSYWLDFSKHYSYNEKHWYCSQLVWACYKNQGIDIEDKGFFSGPGVTPRDIRDCDNTYTIDIK